MEQTITFKLEDFEGPLDLLLYLVSKNKMNIYDIEIVALIDQYVSMVNGLPVYQMESASEFIEMAARLVQMKSYFLLPKSEEAERMKEELTGMLVEYSACKEVAAQLRSMAEGVYTVVREPAEVELDTEYRLRHDVYLLEEAYNALSQTRDGQLCDIIIDRAALEAIERAGQASDSELIRQYAELTVAAADIKTAVRCRRTGKPLEFIRRALAPCASLDVYQLAKAAAEGDEAISDYLSLTDYAGAVPALEQSPSAFERWCDNVIIESIRPQQFLAFGIGPLAAYILGHENEIKTVRIILSGKRNDLPEASIRERVREMYE